MIKIERVQQTRRGRMALFDADDFLFSVDMETLAKWKIEEGSSLTEEELSLLRSDSDTRKAKDSALRYLSLRSYGEQELYGKLCLKFDEFSAAAAVATMCELNLLNDETFAYEKAAGMAQRRKSKSEIRRKLLELGISADLVSAAVEEAAPDDAATALGLVQRSYMEKLRKGEKEKVMAALGRRGFKYQDIRSAIGEATLLLEEESEQLLE